MKERKKNERAIPYIASIDGIRAIAIISVLIFHVSPKALSGGFTGVDVFFVLSGFLITSVILHDVREGSFSFREFYVRRVQRLLPNAIASILAVLLLWTLFMPPGMEVQPGVHGLWTLFNLSNIYLWRYVGGYWTSAAETAPLTHFWSLGIEEQFYVVFPVSLWLLLRLQSRHVQRWLVILAVLSFGRCLYGSYTRPSETFYILPTRVWELFVGAILAVHFACSPKDWPQGRFPLGPKLREAMGWTGLCMIAAGFVFIAEDARFPGWVALAPTLGTLLVLLSVTQGENRLSRLLSTRFMVATGKLSYSLYLWHWPLIVFGQRQAELRGLSPLMGGAAGCLVSILFAWGAFKFIEQPLRSAGSGRGPRLAVIAGAFCFAVLCCASMTPGRREIDPYHRFDSPSWSADLFNSGLFDSWKFRNASFYDMHYPPEPPPPERTWREGGIIQRYGGGAPRVVVFGSSHALMYSPLINDICRDQGISVAFLGMSFGQSPFFEGAVSTNFSTLAEAREFDETRRQWLSKWHPDALIIIDKWDLKIAEGDPLDLKLRAFLTEVSPLVGCVMFTAQVPTLGIPKDVNPRGFVTWSTGGENGLPRLLPDVNEWRRKQTLEIAGAIAEGFPKLRVLRPDLAFYHEDGSIRYEEGRRFFYADVGHLTDVGTEEVRELFKKAIAEACSVSSSH